MRKILSTIILVSAAMLPTGCGSSQTDDAENSGAETEDSIMPDDDLEVTELDKVPLPCTKEALSAAWKQIGTVDIKKGKSLDYKQNTPSLFISTDLDDDKHPEILLRGEQPYAAIFTFVKDSLHLITFVDHPQTGISITQDGVIVRSGSNRDGSFISQFIRLKNSQTAATGATVETFTIKNNEVVSEGIEYMLQNDSAITKVSKEEYQKVAPTQTGTYIEDIDGWEDFRKP